MPAYSEITINISENEPTINFDCQSLTLDESRIFIDALNKIRNAFSYGMTYPKREVSSIPDIAPIDSAVEIEVPEVML